MVTSKFPYRINIYTKLPPLHSSSYLLLPTRMYCTIGIPTQHWIS